MMTDLFEIAGIHPITLRSSNASQLPHMRRMLLFVSIICFVIVGMCSLLVVRAEEKTVPPVVKGTAPLGIVDGMTVPLLIRGFKLGEITELKFPQLKTSPVFRIKSKGAAPGVQRVPTEKIGDTQVEVELTLPVDTPPGTTTFIVIGPKGQSEPRKLVVLESTKTVAEKEPNDGFGQAQEVTLGQTITGVLKGDQNADVFRFTAEAGQRVKIEVQAAQLGSLLNPFVLLHDADGQLLMEMDDGPNGTDPVLEITLPKTGRYFLSIRDADSTSSPIHAYLIRTRGQ